MIEYTTIMSSKESQIETLRELPVIPFYLPNNDAYVEYKRICEQHLIDLYETDQSLEEIAPLAVAKGMLRANIIKRRDHTNQAELLALNGHMPPYHGAVAADELADVAARDLAELVTNPKLPSMELEARIIVGEQRQFLGRALSDHVSAGMLMFMNSNGQSAEARSWPNPDMSIKLSRMINNEFAVIKSKTEGSEIIEVEVDGAERSKLQVVGRQTNLVKLEDLDSDELNLLRRLESEVASCDKEEIDDIKHEIMLMFFAKDSLVRPVLERAYARKVTTADFAS